MEYPRSDAPSTIRFAGAIPVGHRDPMVSYPEWWNEIVNSGKHVVAVAQGTLATNPIELMISTMQAFAAAMNSLLLWLWGERPDASKRDHCS